MDGFCCWSELPSCLLFEITDRLKLYDDYVRFSAVCISWRNVYEEDKKKRLSSSCLPFLLVPPHNHELIGRVVYQNCGKGRGRNPTQDPVETQRRKKLLNELRCKRRLIPQIRNLYNVVNQKVCDFEVHLPHNHYCRGSSFGWLVTMKPKKKFGSYRKFYVQLFNPFLSEKHNIINLPPLYKILKQASYFSTPLFYLEKVVLSCNPLFKKDFVVVAIVNPPIRRLAFYRPGNKDWILIDWEREDKFMDVIYFNKSQQFYAALQTGEVIAIDLVTEAGATGGVEHINPRLTQVAPPTHDFPQFIGRRYLVETSSGELLQVYKVFARYNKSSRDEYVKMEVYKLDPVTVEWSRIYDMGDTVLFIGDSSSISRSASDFPGCKPNCIYYTDDMSMEERIGALYKPQAMGIYNLADGTHQPHYPTASRINFPAPIWLEPTLQRCSHLQYLNEESNIHSRTLSTTLYFDNSSPIV